MLMEKMQMDGYSVRENMMTAMKCIDLIETMHPQMAMVLYGSITDTIAAMNGITGPELIAFMAPLVQEVHDELGVALVEKGVN